MWQSWFFKKWIPNHNKISTSLFDFPIQKHPKRKEELGSKRWQHIDIDDWVCRLTKTEPMTIKGLWSKSTIYSIHLWFMVWMGMRMENGECTNNHHHNSDWTIRMTRIKSIQVQIQMPTVQYLNGNLKTIWIKIIS